MLFFTYLVVSVAAATLCTVLALNLRESRGVQAATLTGVGTYLMIVVLAGALMPTIDEIGDFPGDVLWNFRLASIITLTALWATIGIALTVLVRRLHAGNLTEQARREFVASL